MKIWLACVLLVQTAAQCATVELQLGAALLQSQRLLQREAPEPPKHFIEAGSNARLLERMVHVSPPDLASSGYSRKWVFIHILVILGWASAGIILALILAKTFEYKNDDVSRAALEKLAKPHKHSEASGTGTHLVQDVLVQVGFSEHLRPNKHSCFEAVLHYRESVTLQGSLPLGRHHYRQTDSDSDGQPMGRAASLDSVQSAPVGRSNVQEAKLPSALKTAHSGTKSESQESVPLELICSQLWDGNTETVICRDLSGREVGRFLVEDELDVFWLLDELERATGTRCYRLIDKDGNLLTEGVTEKRVRWSGRVDTFDDLLSDQSQLSPEALPLAETRLGDSDDAA